MVSETTTQSSPCPRAEAPAGARSAAAKPLTCQTFPQVPLWDPPNCQPLQQEHGAPELNQVINGAQGVIHSPDPELLGYPQA